MCEPKKWDGSGHFLTRGGSGAPAEARELSEKLWVRLKCSKISLLLASYSLCYCDELGAHYSQPKGVSFLFCLFLEGRSMLSYRDCQRIQ